MANFTGDTVAIITGTGSNLQTALAREILGQGGAVFTWPKNVCDQGEIREAIGECLRLFGRIDILINCPPEADSVSFLEIEPEDWEELTTGYFRTVFLWTREVCRWFKDQRRPGRVLNVSSMRPELINQSLSGLVTSQAGIAAFTKSLAGELAPLGIKIKLIEPGNRKLYYEEIERV